MGLLRTAIVTILVLIGGAVYWDVFRPWWYQTPVKAPEQIISEADRRCYRVLAWDDAYNEDELVFVVFAAMNLSKELKIQPCDIYKQAYTIRAPSQPLATPLKLFGRKIEAVDTYADQFTGAEAWKARASEVVGKILTDPSPYLKQYPWLSRVTRYIRSKNRILAWTDETAMRSEMHLVYKSPLGGEFFDPK